jgi:hypothetical protein
MQREAIIVMLGFCLTILVASAIVADAGPLDPPGGPVASSMKTLDDVEPRIPLNQSTAPGDADSLFKITEAGSYYLTGNIQGVASKHAIEIAVPSVTLDLAGFTMNGAPSSLDAIHVEPVGLPLLIEIRNGTISGWTEDGIDAEAAIGIRIEDVAVTLCQGFAFRLGDQVYGSPAESTEFPRQQIVPISRTIINNKPLSRALKLLLKGVTEDEQYRNLSGIATDLKFYSARIRNRTAQINLKFEDEEIVEESWEGSGFKNDDFVKAVELTARQFPGIERVSICVNGVENYADFGSEPIKCSFGMFKTQH